MRAELGTEPSIAFKELPPSKMPGQQRDLAGGRCARRCARPPHTRPFQWSVSGWPGAEKSQTFAERGRSVPSAPADRLPVHRRQRTRERGSVPPARVPQRGEGAAGFSRGRHRGCWAGRAVRRAREGARVPRRVEVDGSFAGLTGRECVCRRPAGFHPGPAGPDEHEGANQEERRQADRDVDDVVGGMGEDERDHPAVAEI